MDNTELQKLFDQNRFQEALIELEQRVKKDKLNPSLWNDIGVCNYRLGYSQRTIEAYNKALEIKPSEWTYSNLGEIYKNTGEPEKAIQYYDKALEINPNFAIAESNKLLCMLYFEKEEKIYNAHQDFFNKHNKESNFKNNKVGKKIKLAYMSGDFSEHAVAKFIYPIIKYHNRDQFEVILIHTSPLQDNITEKFKVIADQYINIYKMQTSDSVKRLREKKINILVDLSGHTANSRKDIIIERVANKQVEYLGYPHLSGIPNIDHRITDKYADLTYKKSDIDLEMECMWSYWPIHNPQIKTPPSYKNKHKTIGTFNNIAKLRKRSIPNLSPDDKIVFKSEFFREEQFRKSFIKKYNLPEDRTILLTKTPSGYDAMDQYNQLDYVFDTSPYNGTTTTCDALWMGKYFIEHKNSGADHRSRTTESIWNNADWKYYFDDLNITHQIRRKQIMKSKLMDYKGNTQELEKHYKRIL